MNPARAGLAACVVAAGVIGAGHAAPAPAPAPAAGVVLEIAPDKSETSDGRFPCVKAVLTNRGGRAVTLVLPRDRGGFGGAGAAVVGWSVLGAGDKAKHPDRAPSAEFVMVALGRRPRVADEVFTLKPGQSQALGVWMALWPTEPGRYRVVLYYENVPALPMKGFDFGGYYSDTAKRVRGSAPCRLKSNELVLTVEAKKE